MLKLNVAPIFAARGIFKPNAFLRKYGFTANGASDVVTGKVQKINFKRMEQICLLLNCLPQDIIEWIPDESITEPKKYELSKLMHETKVVVLSDELKGLPLAKIKEVYSFIEEKKREVSL